MTRTYASPLAFKTAVERRLNNDASASGMNLNRRRQLFVFDRFLARVFNFLEDAVVLKGGMVIELRLQRARTTRDIDLRMVGNPDAVLADLQAAGRLELGEYLAFKVQADPRHPEIEAEGMTYQGLRFKAQGQLAGKPYSAPFGIDVAFGEPLCGLPEEIEGSPFLQFAGIEPARFRIYPVATHIAEKLHAYTLPRRRPNSRVKDLPDIALLATAGDIESVTLRQTIERTFEHRATHPVPEAVPDPPGTWGPVYERIAKNDGLNWKTLGDVTQAVQDFLNPALAGESLTWKADEYAWSPSEAE